LLLEIPAFAGMTANDGLGVVLRISAIGKESIEAARQVSGSRGIAGYDRLWVGSGMSGMHADSGKARDLRLMAAN
jgi:hypothetical protein